jgi:2-polyprenyl-6-methoxyphenol hydroxylase-like FAD-dependent oxidoreductase
MSASAPAVLIVGAGPTGLTAAMELSRFGIPVRIIDKLPEPRSTSRALALHARTMELLEQRGPAEEMLRLGTKAQVTHVMADGETLFRIDFASLPSRYNFILLLSQAETERILRDQLARQGVEVERPVEMIALAQTKAGVRAVLRHKDGLLEEMEPAYLICAEGAHSSIRHTLNLPFAGTSLQQGYVLADLYLDGATPDDELSMFLSTHGLLAVFPMGHRRFRLIASEPQSSAGETTADPSLGEVQAIFDLYSGQQARLRDLSWSSRFRINTRMVKTLRQDTVFFGGDSAHVHSPAGGQGMNTGIQDMIDLCWKIAFVLKGYAKPSLLDTYDEERLPVISHVLNTTEKMTETMQASTSGLSHQIFTHLAPMLAGTDFVQQKGTARLSQIAFHYRASSLSANDGHEGSLRAGDRVPDMAVSELHGTATGEARLFTLLDPSKITLLYTGEKVGDGVPKNEWGEMVKAVCVKAVAEPKSAAVFRGSFGERNGLYAVRPDGYLGFAGKQNAEPALRNWLAKWFDATQGSVAVGVR